MIEIDEETVDKAIDDILGMDEPVRDTETQSLGGVQTTENDKARWDIPGEGTERATCRKCGTTFLRPRKSKRTICPACFSATVSASMKASHAKRRERREAAAAASAGAVQEETGGRPMVAPTTGAASAGPSRLPPTGAAARPDENSTNLYPSDELQAKWEALKEAEDTSSAPLEPEPPEREPENWSEDELRGKLAKGLKKDAGDVVLALYECVRDVARTAGIQTRIVLESMYELDTVLSHIGGV